MKQLTLDLDPDQAGHVSAYVRELEICYRICGTTGAKRLDSAPAIVEHMTPFLNFRPDVEKFWVVCLNRKNKPLGVHVVTIGTATAALAHPREVFRAAIIASACAIVCVHNHPSGVMPHDFLCRTPLSPASEIAHLDAA